MRPLPAGLPQGTVVRVPARDVVVYTSVHAAIIDQLGEAGRIIGVCEPRYMETPVIQEGLRAGRVVDLGEATAPNVERMIEIGAELVIASPFENSGYGPVEKIGIPIIEGADYMESSPLGRTEWIRFYGLLFGQEKRADSLFRETERAYLSLKTLAADVAERPTVFSEKKYGSSWYMPAGDSYMARLYADAGADYVFKTLPGSGSTPLLFLLYATEKPPSNLRCRFSVKNFCPVKKAESLRPAELLCRNRALKVSLRVDAEDLLPRSFPPRVLRGKPLWCTLITGISRQGCCKAAVMRKAGIPPIGA